MNQFTFKLNWDIFFAAIESTEEAEVPHKEKKAAKAQKKVLVEA